MVVFSKRQVFYICESRIWNRPSILDESVSRRKALHPSRTFLWNHPRSLYRKYVDLSNHFKHLITYQCVIEWRYCGILRINYSKSQKERPMTWRTTREIKLDMGNQKKIIAIHSTSLVMIISSEFKCIGLGKYQSYYERDQLPTFRSNWQSLINYCLQLWIRQVSFSPFTGQRSETDSPSLAFAHSPILLHNV